MTEDGAGATASESPTAGGGADDLVFTVVLVDEESPLRVLARASSEALARAIYETALNEHPRERVLLRRGDATLRDSSETTG